MTYRAIYAYAWDIVERGVSSVIDEVRDVGFNTISLAGAYHGAGVAATDAAFLNPTRWAIARQGIAAAVGENAGITYRWGLIRLRQRTPAWRVSPSCDRPPRCGPSSSRRRTGRR